MCEVASTVLGNLTMAFPHVKAAYGADVRDKIIGGAGGDLDPEMAWIRSVVECAERYATMVYQPADFVIATADELGSDALDLATIPRCSDRELADPQCTLQLARKDRRIRWIPGYSLISGRRKMVPGAMTFLYFGLWPTERFWLPISTGVAAHTSLAAALVSAICETIERDAIALTWLARLPVPRINRPSSLPEVTETLFQRLDQSHVKQYFFDATTDIGIPTVLSVQVCPDHPTCALFLCCATALDSMTAFGKTIREAIPARNVMALERTRPEHVMDFFDLAHGANYYGCGEHNEDFDFLLKGDNVTTLDQVAGDFPADIEEEDAELRSQRELAFLVDRLRKIGWEAVAVDLTTDELRDVGLWAVRVIIPQAVPISFVHRARYLGTPRLYEYPERLGIELTEDDINPGPMPFA